MSQKRQKIDLLKSSAHPIHRKEQQLKTQLEELTEASNNLNEKLGEEDQALQARQRELVAALKKAKESTGDNYNAIKPPRDLIDAWTEHGYERFDYHHAMMNHENLSNQNEGLEKVDK